MNIDNVLIPINPKFHEIFDDYMNVDLRKKLRAHTVREYTEGIINLLLHDVIALQLKENESFNSLNWKRKLNYIDNYNAEIGSKLRKIFEIGGGGSHYSGSIQDDDLNNIITLAIHLVEDIFVDYFSKPEHTFGSENIYTFFSMLPLKNRIYILEKLEPNTDVVDRLSMTYVKDGNMEAAINLIENALTKKIVSLEFVQFQKERIALLNNELPLIQEMNSNYDGSSKTIQALACGNQIVVGMPSSKNIFDTKKALMFLDASFKELQTQYPQFCNLFLYLMMTDDRIYK